MPSNVLLPVHTRAAGSARGRTAHLEAQEVKRGRDELAVARVDGALGRAGRRLERVGTPYAVDPGSTGPGKCMLNVD